MMDAEAIAKQLRKPEGELGKQVSEKMNIGNELINQWVIEQLEVKPGHHVLEIGMGNGFFVKSIVERDASIKYWGCDFSETMVEEATRINQKFVADKRVEFVLASAHDLPFDDSVFDRVFAINTLYFWENPARELKEILRVLKIGGELVLGIRPRSVMQHYPFVKHGFVLYEKDDVVNILSDAGFVVRDVIEKNEPDQQINGQSLKVVSVIIKASIKVNLR